MAYEVIILGHLHMPLYFLGTFTEYPQIKCKYLTHGIRIKSKRSIIKEKCEKSYRPLALYHLFYKNELILGVIKRS